MSVLESLSFTDTAIESYKKCDDSIRVLLIMREYENSNNVTKYYCIVARDDRAIITTELIDDSKAELFYRSVMSVVEFIPVCIVDSKLTSLYTELLK